MNTQKLSGSDPLHFSDLIYAHVFCPSLSIFLCRLKKNSDQFWNSKFPHVVSIMSNTNTEHGITKFLNPNNFHLRFGSRLHVQLEIDVGDNGSFTRFGSRGIRHGENYGVIHFSGNRRLRQSRWVKRGKYFMFEEQKCRLCYDQREWPIEVVWLLYDSNNDILVPS